MIDRPDQVGRLMEQLSASLPIPARVTPELQAILDPRLPLARDIVTYQKHRVKRLRRQPR